MDEKVGSIDLIAQQIAQIQSKMAAGQYEQEAAFQELFRIASALQYDELIKIDEKVMQLLKNVDSDKKF